MKTTWTLELTHDECIALGKVMDEWYHRTSPDFTTEVNFFKIIDKLPDGNELNTLRVITLQAEAEINGKA